MSQSLRPSHLRQALRADALISGATGALMLFGASLVSDLLGLPASLLRGAGLVLLPYAAFVAYVAKPQVLSRGAVWTVIGCNFAWALASALFLAGGFSSPSALGYAFVAFQALVVAIFGELQFVGLRRQVAVA